MFGLNVMASSNCESNEDMGGNRQRNASKIPDDSEVETLLSVTRFHEKNSEIFNRRSQQVLWYGGSIWASFRL